MKTNSMPGFVAENSLHSASLPYAQWKPGGSKATQIVPQLRPETGSGFCARKANECTDGCRPSDSDCRDDCDTLFWCCLTGCDVVIDRSALFRLGKQVIFR